MVDDKGNLRSVQAKKIQNRYVLPGCEHCRPLSSQTCRRIEGKPLLNQIGRSQCAYSYKDRGILFSLL